MHMNETPLLGVCQTPVLQDRDMLLQFLDQAAAHKAKHGGGEALFLFPELFWGGFDYENRQALAAATPELLDSLQQACLTRGIMLAGTFWETRGPDYYNTFYLVGKGQKPERVRSKRMLFTLSDELRFFKPGNAQPAPIQCMGLSCGVGICFELRFPEIFRYQSAQGMDLLLISSQWPARRLLHQETLCRARAIENQCYVLVCNACGASPYGTLGGGSRCLSPWGEDLFACTGEPGVMSVPFLPQLLERARAAFNTRPESNTWAFSRAP